MRPHPHATHIPYRATPRQHARHASRRCGVEPTRGSRRCGFSYIEAVISTVILATALSSGLHLFAVYAKGASVALNQQVADWLCTDLMAEVMSRDINPDEDFWVALEDMGLPDISTDAAREFQSELALLPLTASEVRCSSLYEAKGTKTIKRNRLHYIDDYHGWTELPPRASDGSELDGQRSGKYVRIAEVYSVDAASLSSRVARGSSPSRFVRVTVFQDGRLLAQLVAFKTVTDQ